MGRFHLTLSHIEPGQKDFPGRSQAVGTITARGVVQKSKHSRQQFTRQISLFPLMIEQTAGGGNMMAR